jgi:hypothetical protein
MKVGIAKDLHLSVSFNENALKHDAMAGEKLTEINLTEDYYKQHMGSLTPIFTDKVLYKYCLAIQDKIAHPKYEDYNVVVRNDLRKDDIIGYLYIEALPAHDYAWTNDTIGKLTDFKSGDIVTRAKVQYFVPFAVDERMVLKDDGNMLYIIKKPTTLN